MSTATAINEVAERARQNVPKVVRMLLTISGHSARELAKATGMTESKVSERLNGKTRISSDELAAWAAFLDIDPGLFYRSPSTLMRLITTVPEQGDRPSTWDAGSHFRPALRAAS